MTIRRTQHTSTTPHCDEVSPVKPSTEVTDRSIVPHKAELLKIAHMVQPYNSFADLGACWHVHGGYAFRAREICGDRFERAVVVDQHITPLTIERASSHPDIELVPALLGTEAARSAVGQVDALILYDILLHQVEPNWDRFLLDWLPHAEMLIIYNQMWLRGHKTIRFIDRGLDWFKANVPYTDERAIDRWFAEHDEIDAHQNKRRRDMHNFWQWGITVPDLVRLLSDHAFDLAYMKHYGPFSSTKPWIANNGLIFVRSRFRAA